MSFETVSRTTWIFGDEAASDFITFARQNILLVVSSRSDAHDLSASHVRVLDTIGFARVVENITLTDVNRLHLHARRVTARHFLTALDFSVRIHGLEGSQVRIGR